MVTLKVIQDNIYKYNEACNKKKLKLPSKISKTSEKEILDSLFSDWVNKEVTFTSSKDTLHPNLIKYLIDTKVCKIVREDRNKNKSWCYLENNKGEKIKISKQIYFGYQFIKKLKRYKNRKYVRDFFDEDGYITNLKLEEWVRSWNGVKNTRRLDFIFEIDEDKKIVVEYLEDHHLSEFKNWNSYQTIRLVDILFSHNRTDIIHFAFIWDHLMDEDYLNKKVKFFCKICKDQYNIDNEEKYIVNILNEHVNNKDLSKLLFDSYKNENKPILRLNKINNLFKIKEEKYDYLKNEFIKEVHDEDDDDDDEDDDEDEDVDGDVFEDIQEEKEVYYEEIDDKIVISNHGLCLYLDLLRKEHFYRKKNYKNKVKFINRIGKSAYSSANKIRDLIINQKENIISGLEEIK
jgi:hypothetical protein